MLVASLVHGSLSLLLIYLLLVALLVILMALPASDENASYRPRALLYQDDDCIVPEEDFNAERSYKSE